MISSEDYNQISKHLEASNAIFQTFWSIGNPIFTEEIPTACVGIEPYSNSIIYKFNPVFWESLDNYKRAFVVSHECLHIFLNHLSRTNNVAIQDLEIANQALDVVVNHLLVDRFGFVREKIDPENKYCWIDIVFSERLSNGENIKHGENFEYYFLLLKEKIDSSDYGKQIFDVHSFDGDKGTDEGQGKPSEDEIREKEDIVVDSVGSRISEDEKERFAKHIEDQIQESQSHKAGTHAGGITQWMSTQKVAKKKKWETVIKKWSSKYLKNDFKDMEQWLRVARRIVNLDSSIILPNEMEVEDMFEDKQKIDVHFFLDTSGSCSGLAGRFWKAAKSLPDNRFNISLFCFDTEVYDVDIKVGKLYGFGGTSFRIIEERIQNDLRNKKIKKYPEAVFVITDGYGSYVNMQKPEKWHWFLTQGGSRSCIPNKCNIYELKNFE